MKGPPLAETPLSAPGVMRDIGELLLRRLRKRTREGKDVHGRAFRALSTAYAKAKHKALGHDRADLTVSGRMLADMAVRPTKNTVSVYFTSAGGKATGRTLIQRSRAIGAADKAEWHTISGAGKSRVKREWFDLNAADEAAAQAVLDAYLENLK